MLMPDGGGAQKMQKIDPKEEADERPTMHSMGASKKHAKKRINACRQEIRSSR